MDTKTVSNPAGSAPASDTDDTAVTDRCHAAQVAAPTPWHWERVLAQELDHIERRRTGASAKDLVGLAISGGGIRSATFALGVLESLREKAVLTRIDYLSTVSGGGYVGSWLSANCLRAAQRQEIADAQVTTAEIERKAAEAELDKLRSPRPSPAPPQPRDGRNAPTAEEAATKRLAEACDRAREARDNRSKCPEDWLHPDSRWDASIAHLRRYSNYLAPQLGFLSADTWSMFAIWMRNAVLVQATVILGIAVALLLPRLLFPLFKFWPFVGEYRWATVLLFVFGVAGIAGNLMRVTDDTSRVLQMENWKRGLLVGSALLGAAALVGYLFDFHPFTDVAVRWEIAGPIALLIVIAGFFLLSPAVKLVNRFWPGERRPTKINYGQAAVQGFIVIPMMITGYLVAAVLWGQIESPALYKGELDYVKTYGAFLEKAWRHWQLPLSVAFASLWLLAYCSLREKSNFRHKLVALLAPVVSVLVLHALLCAILLLMKGWSTPGDCDIRVPDTCRGEWLAFMWGPSLVLYSLSLTVNVLIGIVGRQSTEGVREWWSRLGAWMLIYGTAWLVISVAAVYGPQWVSWMAYPGNWATGASGLVAWIATTIGGLLAGRSNTTGSAKGAKLDKSLSARALEWLARLAPIVFIAGLLIGIAAVLHLILTLLSDMPCCNPIGLLDDHWALLSQTDIRMEACVFGATVVALAIMAARIDINEFSLNAFYRNRLTRCYLGATRYLPGQRKPQNFTGFDEADDVRLHEMRASSADARPPLPIHLVNCALNLGGSGDLSVHTRHSASFTFSQYAAGSLYRSHDQRGVGAPLGFQPVERYGGMKGAPTLGQVVAVSGAAASPNMGYHTSPLVAFLLTVFNVRLGAWFPNPRQNDINTSSPWFGLRYLLTELFGGADDKARFLMLSDGGHFENLAAYELVRRKCRVIIISDAECDPEWKFEGLGALIRMCDVDFGAKISIDVSAIIPLAETGWSERRCAVGTIDYAADESGRSPERGVLIYLKASMTGQEDSATLQYKASHPRFPHETTANQFYGEDQFEAYRRLGQQVADRTFAPVYPDRECAYLEGATDAGRVDASVPADSSDTFIKRADILRVMWSTSPAHLRRSSKHGKELMSLWQQIASSPDSRVLSDADETLLAGKWPDEQSKASLRDIYFLCSQMLQLMENVYLDLNLEENWDHPDNEGWRSLFRSWAMSPALQRIWKVSSRNHGRRFQYFCNRELGMKLPDSV